MSEHLISNDTFGKSREILERLTGKTIDELGSVEEVTSGHMIDKLEAIVREIKYVEIKGVENYAQQFQEFVNGFRGIEAPYIFAGLKIFLDAALSSPPFTIPEIKDKIKDKYEEVLQTVEKNTLRVCFTRKTKREDGE